MKQGSRLASSRVSLTRIERAILFLRGHRVILDSDLAEMYGVATRALNQAVRRNRTRFPPDFMFQLAPEEARILRSQIVTSRPWGGPRTRPHAFTEQGVAMLSSVIRELMEPPPSARRRIGFE